MSKILPGELAVKLTEDITGGLGSHKKGTVLRELSFSIFNTLSKGGFAEVLAEGTVVSDAKVENPAPTSLVPTDSPAKTDKK